MDTRTGFPPVSRGGDEAAAAVVSSSGLSKRAVSVYAAAFTLLALAAFTVNVEVSFRSWDSKAWPVLFEIYRQFGSPFSLANANPLAGMFEIFPIGYRGGQGIQLMEWLLDLPLNRSVMLAGNAIFLSGALYLFARAVGFERGVALLGAVLAPVTIMSVFGSVPLTDSVFALSSHLVYFSAVSTLTLALLWMIDGRSPGRTIALAAAMLLAMLHLFLVMALAVTMVLPALLALGTGALAASESLRQLMARLAAVAGGALALCLLGFASYVYALGTYTSYNFFFDELNDFALRIAPDLQALRLDVARTLMLDVFTPAPVIAIGGIGGAIVAAFASPDRRIRVLARTMLAWVVVTPLAAFFAHYMYHFAGIDYKGLSGYHFGHQLFIFYPIFVAFLGVFVGDRLTRRAAVPSILRPAVQRTVRHLLLIDVLVIAAFGATFAANGRGPITEWPRPTPITEYLAGEIGIAYGRPFRGAANNIAAVRPGAPTYDTRQFLKASQLLQYFAGNDMASNGLWLYGIPTLFTFNETTTPQYFLMVSELLSRPIDRHIRAYTLITRTNMPILALWGVRFLIVDYDLPFGDKRLTLTVPALRNGISEGAGWTYQLYELSEPNIGNYSPTHVVAYETATDVVAAMKSADFDGRDTVLVDRRLDGEFIPAVAAEMTVEPGGFTVRAASRGESLLVLPVQYSNCWQMTGAPSATLFRANLLQLGIRFSGSLSAQLRQVFGPFGHAGCRLRDVDDMYRLNVGAARRPP
jgi:hypothetical protein